LAAYLKSDPQEDRRKHPFVILKAIPKPSYEEKGKGGAAPTTTVSKSLYFTPIKICPPPNTGCRIPGG
jgi:hypothetical protein